MQNFSLRTMLWSFAVIAACLAVYRVDVRFAPLVATVYAVYFLIPLRVSERSGLLRFIRIGGISASVGVFCWMILALSLDWTVYLQSESVLDMQMTAAFAATCLGGVIAYAMAGFLVGSIYGAAAYAVRRSCTTQLDQEPSIG
jgi:hypothetical protein